jgi:iron(III) transport system permease protein
MVFQVGVQTLTYQTWLKLVSSPETLSVLSNTILYGIGGASIGAVMAVLYAWIVIRTDVPGKRILVFLPILASVMPMFVKALGWVFLFSPRIGLVNMMFSGLYGSSAVVFNIYTMQGMMFAVGVGGFPLQYLVLEPALRSLNPDCEESSRICGNGLLKTFRKITGPMLLPAILSAFLIHLIMIFENFDYVFLLGGPAGINTMATEVYYYINERSPPDFGSAVAISSIFLIMTFAAFTIYVWVTRRSFRFVTVTGKATHRTHHMLGRWRYAAFALLLFLITISFILPMSTVLLVSVVPYATLTQNFRILSFTLDNFAGALRLPLFYRAITNTILLAIGAGVMTAVMATVLSYASLKGKFRGARLTEYVGAIPLGFPGIVFGLALFWTFLTIPVLSDLLYGTIFALIIAISITRVPHCMRITSGNLIQLSDELEEASKVTGASSWRTIRKITLPLISRGIFNSFIYTFIHAMREISTIILLLTPGTILVMPLLLFLYGEHATALNLVAAGSVIVSAIMILILVVARLLERKLFARYL